jgi:hypothetical protein
LRRISHAPTARAWATGAVSIPEPIAAWLEAWVRHRVEHPDPLAPQDWRRWRQQQAEVA